MKLLILSLSMLLSTAFAADRSAAYETVCKTLSFESAKINCVAKIKNYNYFDGSALAICGSFSFDSNKIECLGKIADKTYDAYETDNCGSLSFDSAKLTCLADGGTIKGSTPACASKEDILGQLNLSINDLHAGNFSNVEMRLNYLITKFTNCSK